MSWLSGLTDSIGSVLGFDNASDSLLGFMDSNQLWPSLFQVGTGLAGQYFQQSAAKDAAEKFAQQQAAQNAFDEKKLAQAKELSLAELANRLEAARISAAASAGAARKSALANMYNNWANLTERGGEAQAGHALATGQGITSGFLNRTGALK